MKKKSLIALLVIIILLIGGGIAVWKINQNKEIKSSDNSPNTKTPLSQLSDEELEKCLLEDFSRRLELKKYFVFSLGELTKEKIKDSYKTYSNGRIVNNSLSSDLTKLSNNYGKGEKKGVFFQEEKLSKPSSDWTGEELDKKIDNSIKNNPIYVIFEKSDEVDYTYGGEAFGGIIYNFVLIRTKSPTTKICEGKNKALEIIKTDPALLGQI